ncbi:hypothetical protein Vretifemale_13788, partial [Volvox reticuliferus]
TAYPEYPCSRATRAPLRAVAMPADCSGVNKIWPRQLVQNGALKSSLSRSSTSSSSDTTAAGSLCSPSADAAARAGAEGLFLCPTTTSSTSRCSNSAAADTPPRSSEPIRRD